MEKPYLNCIFAITLELIYLIYDKSIRHSQKESH